MGEVRRQQEEREVGWGGGQRVQASAVFLHLIVSPSLCSTLGNSHSFVFLFLTSRKRRRSNFRHVVLPGTTQLTLHQGGVARNPRTGEASVEIHKT